LIIALKCPAAFAVIKLLLSISVRTHTHIYYKQHILCVLHHIRSWFPESVSFGGHKCRVFFVHRDRYSFWKQSFLRRSTQALALNGKFKTHVGRVSKAGQNITWADINLWTHPDITFSDIQIHGYYLCVMSQSWDPFTLFIPFKTLIPEVEWTGVIGSKGIAN